MPRYRLAPLSFLNVCCCDTRVSLSICVCVFVFFDISLTCPFDQLVLYGVLRSFEHSCVYVLVCVCVSVVSSPTCLVYSSVALVLRWISSSQVCWRSAYLTVRLRCVAMYYCCCCCCCGDLSSPPLCWHRICWLVFAFLVLRCDGCCVKSGPGRVVVVPVCWVCCNGHRKTIECKEKCWAGVSDETKEVEVLHNLKIVVVNFGGMRKCR